MTDRDDHHHRQLHYVSVLPLNSNAYSNHYQRYLTRRSSEQERSKPLYVDFDNAFEDQTKMNDDYFGFQPIQSNIQHQTVQMISEVENNHIRYHSHPSTPLNIPRSHHRNVRFQNSNNNNENRSVQFTSDINRSQNKQEEIHSKISLPQYFLVKYLGRTSCTQLWGTQAVRTPIDDMVRNARQLPSINDLPTLEACINTCGLILTHRQSSTRHKQQHQHGLIPLDHISYAMHDVKYSKIASCIVLRQMKSINNDRYKTDECLKECYTFLFQSKEYAHRFALAFAQAFSQQNRTFRQQHHEEKIQGRHSRHRSNHQRMHYVGKSNDHHFLDSHV